MFNVNNRPVTIKRLGKPIQWLRVMSRRIMGQGGGILATSMDLTDDPIVAAFLPDKPEFHSRLIRPNAHSFVGWGRRWSGRRAVKMAAQYGANTLLLEDGFLRSVGRNDPPISVCLDDLGIYYDASQPSRLEALIAQPLSDANRQRTHKIIEQWRKARVSKYNAAPEMVQALPADYVLVVDQVRGDLSVRYGLADETAFQAMLTAALLENPDRDVVVKLHPDVFTNAGKSHFDPAVLGKMGRVHIIADTCHPVRLIEQAQAVYTVTSQMGFEALIWGKPVRCFGMPFYAGWGLTDDELPAPDRRAAASVEQLVHAALVGYPRYLDPVTQTPFEVEQAIDHIALQRRLRLALPGHITAVQFSRWKRRFIRAFFTGAKTVFQRRYRPNRVPPTGAVALWGSSRPDALRGDEQVLQVEDGFLRSSGLGADLVRPLSLVIDDVGIYYDATRPSRLENIINQQNLTDTQKDRAGQLSARIVNLGLTKYNLAGQGWKRPDTDQQVILVVGQVESDASIRFGSPDVKSNLAFLQCVRAQHPQAYIVYKPHPDVTAGLRSKGEGEDAAEGFCDEILTQNIAPDALFRQIDQLHTMTSLMGFEALLRGVPVTCHGLPFYAGWGLTRDMLSCDRRRRQITREELVYAALIAYPRYYNFKAECYVEPEQILDELQAWAKSGPSTRPWYRKLLRQVIVTWLTVTGKRR